MIQHRTESSEAAARGPIAWMVDNRITANLLMIILIVGGIFMSSRIKKEVFPEFELDSVSVSVSYPGASPEEVEQGIILAVEEVVRALDGIKEVTATASEGRASIRIELFENVDGQTVYQNIQQEVARITTFPEEAEEPRIALDARRREVLSLQLYGDVSEWGLRNLAEEMRDRLLQSSGITQVDLIGARSYEIHVEIPEQKLRAHSLTLEQIAQRIRAAAIEFPGGSVETDAGEILVRFKDRRDWAREFDELPIVTTAGGTVLRLGDLGSVTEGFQDTDNEAYFNGKRAVSLGVFRIGAETPIGVSDAVRAALHDIEADLPPGVNYAINNDRSEIYRQRLGLLMKNASIGLLLVLLVLGAFLEFKLAFWVTMGIPISFLGGLLFLPLMGVSINMISMFAFIIALGIVVDDAIIAGENIYEYRQRGMNFRDAAILGARDVSTPIAFSILTNIVAFLPLYFVPGFVGKIWKVIPVVVITVFLISWLESLLILPSHLAHTKSRPGSAIAKSLRARQEAFARFVARIIEEKYRPFLDRCLHHRVLVISIALSILIVTFTYVSSGHIGVILMPRVESDRSVVTAVLPFGSPVAAARSVQERLVEAADLVTRENGGETLSEGIFSTIEENEVEVSIYLTDADVRPLTTTQLTELWREQVGAIAGLQSLRFASDRGGPGSGAALTIELSHRDIDVLDRASTALAAQLEEFSNTKDIDDGYTPGKQQLDFQMTSAGRSLGLSSMDVARQVRSAFYGSEALRQQRGRNEVKVLVRRPQSERVSEYNIEQLLIQTPAGSQVPLMQVAEVTRGRSYTSIVRRGGRRTVTVTANVEPIGETNQVKATLNDSVLPQLVRDYPGLSLQYEGRQADMAESVSALVSGLLLAFFAMYFLLAIPFRSYTQPFIVMISIPFGVVGAVLGHLIMGYNLSIISIMGMIALAGVVVNDSLVLVEYANKQFAMGLSRHDAIMAAGVRRFRPILLTTLTTFGGLAPMIFETSRQARFMIPMALSLGYGILFATAISLVLVPTLYLIVEDAITATRSRSREREAAVANS